MQELTNEEQVESGSDPSEGTGLEEQVSSLDIILDIPVHVTVELGRTKMPIKDVIQLSQGSVIELSKMAGEHLEVLINDKLIAKGEVVVVNERFGIRISEILSPAKRLEQLG